MVAKFINSILLVFIMSASIGACVAKGPGSLGADAHALTLNKFEIAKMQLEEKIEKCRKGKVTIPKEVFEGLNLTDKEWKVALFVLGDKAEDACEAGKRGAFVVAASVYRATSRHYHREPVAAISYSEDKLFGHYWKKMESEVDYLKIPKEKRNRLELIPQIQKPFHLFETLTELGIN